MVRRKNVFAKLSRWQFLERKQGGRRAVAASTFKPSTIFFWWSSTRTRVLFFLIRRRFSDEHGILFFSRTFLTCVKSRFHVRESRTSFCSFTYVSNICGHICCFWNIEENALKIFTFEKRKNIMEIAFKIIGVRMPHMSVTYVSDVREISFSRTWKRTWWRSSEHTSFLKLRSTIDFFRFESGSEAPSLRRLAQRRLINGRQRRPFDSS